MKDSGVEVVDSVLLSRLDALDEAREIAAQYFAAVDVEGLDLVRVKVRSRLRHGTANTVVAIAGATGSGKSSIVNRLAGSNLSEASVRRPTTSATHAVIWGAADAGPLLDWLEISRRHQIEMQHADFDGLVVLDLPDHDSTAVEHRLEVDRLVELVDVVVWVTDPQKYADAALHHGYIQPLATHAGMLRFVLNQIDRLGDGGSAVAADLARLLDDDGIPNAEIIAVSALTGDGFGQLEAVLARAIAERTAMLERVEVDLADAAAGFGRSGAMRSAGEAEERLVAGLSEAAGSAEAARVAANHHKRQGSLAMGWPFTRFLRRLARKPLADLPGPGRHSAAEPRADLALRDYAEDVAGDAEAPWPGALRSAVSQHRGALLDDLRRSVGREALAAGARSRWWSAVAWLQRVFAGAAVVGLGWLIVVAVLGGFFKLATDPLLPPTPGADWIPLPSALLLGGVLLGLLFGLLMRVPLAVASRRRGRRAQKAIEHQVRGHATTRVIEPVMQVVRDREALEELCRSVGS